MRLKWVVTGLQSKQWKWGTEERKNCEDRRRKWREKAEKLTCPLITDICLSNMVLSKPLSV